MTVLDFLTGGVYSTLRELLIGITQWLITFITDTSANFYNPLITLVINLLPTFNDLYSHLQTLFNIVSPYIGYILDFLFISQPVFTYIILSLIFKVTIRLQVYIMKLLLKWYKAIFP